MKNKDSRRSSFAALLLLCMAAQLAGCQHAPLAPDHGYPAAWPRPIALAKGAAELGGTYANQGIATGADGSLGPITLASLIPKNKPLARHDFALPGKPVHEDSVKLVVVPPKSAWEPYASLRAFVASGGSMAGFKIETASDENVLLYVLKVSGSSFGSVGASGSQTRVFLTRGEDGSLIAQIHSEDYALVLVAPYYSSGYTWARFERIGD